MSDYDVLVVGSGIGGMESALKLGDMGYKVLVVEKEPSVGGKMILLSKVFPTLDCASCISTPKMAATIHHPNVTVFTGSEVDEIARDAHGGFHATVKRKPRFVDEAACTGCRQCEFACTVAVPDQFNGDMVSRRAAYIAFPQAVPQKALIERAGTSPCTYACPAGIKAHGYVSLVRSGEYEKAFELVLETTPLVGSLGRACYAPCEGECTRGSLEGPLAIRRIKRFIADTHYALENGKAGAPAENGKRVAVIGSGPAGLTAAWQLARKGYGVKIFEAAPVAGGALRLAIPSYRLPAEVVEHDVANVTEPRRRDRDRRARRRRGSAEARRVRRGRRRHRHAARGEAPRRRRGARGERARLPPRRQARPGARPRRQGRRRRRRRQRRHRHRPHRAAPRRGRGAHGLPRVAAGDAGVRLGGRRGGRRGRRAARLLGHRRLPRRRGRRAEAVHRRLRREPPVQPAVRRVRHERGRLRRRDRRDRHGPRAESRGRPGHAPDARAVGLRRRRRHHRRIDDPEGRRERAARGAHGRPLPPGSPARRLRRAARRRRQARRPRAPGQPQPARAARGRRPLRGRPDGLRRDRGRTHRGRGACGRRPLPRLRRLLRVPRVHLRVPRGRHRPRHAREGGRARRRRRDRLDRLHALPRRREAAVRPRPLPERHHRHADGAPARPDAPVQHGAAPERRQGAGADRLRHVHRLARRDRRQPAVLEVLLHVLDQAEPADHGRAAARGRHRPLHRHPRGRQGLRRVLRAGEGDGRELRQGPRRLDPRDRRRRPHAPLRGHRQRRHGRRGRVRPRRPRRRRPAEPRRPAPLQGRGARGRRLRLRRRGRRGPESRPGRAFPASSSPAPPPARATSPSRSSTPAPRWRRRPRISSARRCSHERTAHRRLRLPLRRQHLRLRRRRARRRHGQGRARRRRRAPRDVHVLGRDAAGDRRRHQGAAARRPRRRLLLAEAAHVHVPRGGSPRRPQPVRVHAGEHPRAVLVDAHRRPRGSDEQGDQARARRHRAHAAVRAARAGRGRDDAGSARDRRRRRRHARRDRARRRRARHVPRRARAGARRLGRRPRRALPARQGRPRSHRAPAGRDPAAHRHHRVHERRGDREVRHVRQLPRDRQGRGRRVDPPRGRPDRRRHRFRQLRAARGRVRATAPTAC